MPADLRCELCERWVPELTDHHLVPKSKGRRQGIKVHELPVAKLCHGCHKQIHVLFSNEELATRLNSVEALKQEDAVVRYLSFARKQNPHQRIRVRR